MERLNGKVKQLQQEIRNLNGEIEDKEQKVGDRNFHIAKTRLFKYIGNFIGKKRIIFR